MSETYEIITDDYGVQRIELPKDHKMVCGWCGSGNLNIYRPVQLPPAPPDTFVCQCKDCGDAALMPVIHENKGAGYDKYGVKIDAKA